MAQVTMYYKVTCPYCTRAEKILKEHQVTDLEKISIDTNRKTHKIRTLQLSNRNNRVSVCKDAISRIYPSRCLMRHTFS